MTQSLCKHGMEPQKNNPGIKLDCAGVFSCKDPLLLHLRSLHVGVLADSESEDESSEDEKRRKKERKSSKKKKRKSRHKKKR